MKALANCIWRGLNDVFLFRGKSREDDLFARSGDCTLKPSLEEMKSTVLVREMPGLTSRVDGYCFRSDSFLIDFYWRRRVDFCMRTLAYFLGF